MRLSKGIGWREMPRRFIVARASRWRSGVTSPRTVESPANIAITQHAASLSKSVVMPSVLDPRSRPALKTRETQRKRGEPEVRSQETQEDKCAGSVRELCWSAGVIGVR